ncbi:hypothetical protein QE152_g1199 [Popillia japonica]|uniref:Uncharacterized protein n=1 Tax=Popillia japonica TaxID=7064 RepID=A0AAW1N884_POPJA
MAIDQQTFLTDQMGDQMGTLEASASDYPFRCQAVIVPRLRADIILGQPWLQENSAVMDGLRTRMPPRRDHRAPNRPFLQHPAAADHSRHQLGEASPPPAGPDSRRTSQDPASRSVQGQEGQAEPTSP